ncbi:unnamed protein product, partial [Urochloa humidicola]
HSSRGACQRRQTGPVFNLNGCNIQVNLIIQTGAPAQGRTFPTALIGRPVTKIPAAAPPGNTPRFPSPPPAISRDHGLGSISSSSHGVLRKFTEEEEQIEELGFLHQPIDPNFVLLGPLLGFLLQPNRNLFLWPPLGPNNQATLVRPKANGGAANVKKVRETQHNVMGKPKDKVHVGHAKPAVKCVQVVTCHRH